MLSFITSIADPLLEYVKDDPVRPEISKEFRVGDNRFVSALIEDQLKAMVCVSIQDYVPTTVEELAETAESYTIAIFYTIWSYVPGAGADLLFKTVKEIKEQYPSVDRFVTLSPKTEMAKKFHLKNGAFVLQENATTVNYEYKRV